MALSTRINNRITIKISKLKPIVKLVSFEKVATKFNDEQVTSTDPSFINSLDEYN